MTLEATLDDEQLTARLDAQTGADGVLHGVLRSGLDADAALSGEVSLDIAQLAWLELLSPDLAAPSGHLHGQLSVAGRSEEHTSELQSLMRISYAVFCLK